MEERDREVREASGESADKLFTAVCSGAQFLPGP